MKGYKKRKILATYSTLSVFINSYTKNYQKALQKYPKSTFKTNKFNYKKYVELILKLKML